MSPAVPIFHERFDRATILRLSKSGLAKFGEGTRPCSREALERDER